MQILKLHRALGVKYLQLNVSDFFFPKNSSLHDNLTPIPHFLPYKTKSAYQLFSTISICKSAIKLIIRKSPVINLSTELQTKSLINVYCHYGFRYN